MDMHSEPIKTIHPDMQGRISLGALAKGIDSFQVFKTENNELLLKPFVSIPANEAWLFQNKKALKNVLAGAQESEEGKVVDAPEDYSRYIDDE